MSASTRRPRTPRAPRRATIIPIERLRRDAGVRWSRVRAAKARIAAGFYDREDVRDRLADAVYEELRSG